MMRRSVDLPQPEGPISETNSRGAHLEVDLLQRADAAAREVLRQRLERDDRSLLVHTKCSGARLTTSFSVRTMRRKKAMPRSAAMMLVAQRLSGELA